MNRTRMWRRTILTMISLCIGLRHRTLSTEQLSLSHLLFLAFGSCFHRIVTLPSLPILEFDFAAWQRGIATGTSLLLTWNEILQFHQDIPSNTWFCSHLTLQINQFMCLIFQGNSSLDARHPVSTQEVVSGVLPWKNLVSILEVTIYNSKPVLACWILDKP